MELEQLPPNKPNFLLVVLLAGAAILVIFGVVLALLGFDGKRLLHSHHQHTQETWNAPAISTTFDC